MGKKLLGGMKAAKVLKGLFVTNKISVELWEINHVYDDTYIWSEIVVALIVHLTRYSMSLCISETLQAIK